MWDQAPHGRTFWGITNDAGKPRLMMDSGRAQFRVDIGGNELQELIEEAFRLLAPSDRKRVLQRIQESEPSQARPDKTEKPADQPPPPAPYHDQAGGDLGALDIGMSAKKDFDKGKKNAK